MKEINVSYTLKQLILYFLRLGFTGFGGPVALIGYIHQDLVEKRKWISEEEYKEGLALAQLAPGPLAAQLGIYLGYVHYGVLGATLCGLAFVLPSFFIVVLIGIFYKLYGGISWMQSVFYGVGAAVVGIIAVNSYKLTLKSVSKLQVPEMKKHWRLWMIFFVTVAVTVITKNKEADLMTFRNEIRELLEEEICARYYLERGETEAKFDNDKELQEAIKILKNPAKYKEILRKK